MHPLIQRLSRLAAAVAVSTVATAPALAASLDTYAGGVGGLARGSVNSGCYTSGTPAALQPFFRGGSFPDGGIAACGLTGGLDQDSGTAGMVNSTFTIAPVKLGIPASSAGRYSGQADARAGYGVLGVAAQGRFEGGVANGGPGTYDNTVAAAKFTDTLTATSAGVAPGSAGFVRYAFELHGSASALGAPAAYYTGNTFVELLYAQTGSTAYGWNLAVGRGTRGLIQNTTPPAGWTSGTSFLSGRSTFSSFDLPITWGQGWDLTVGLVATAHGEAIADFLGTARMTGVQLFDSRHQEVTDFQLRAASGTNYLAPVPEAGSAWLMLAGLGGLGGLARVRRRPRCEA